MTHVAGFVLRWALLSIWLLLLTASLLAFYGRYWRWRGCFNELGRCYGQLTQEVYLEQAGIVRGSFALVFASLALLSVRRLLKA